MSKLIEALTRLFTHATPEVAATKEVLEEVGTHLNDALTTVLKEHEEAVVTRVKSLLSGIEADLMAELGKLTGAKAQEAPAEAPQAPSEAQKASE